MLKLTKKEVDEFFSSRFRAFKGSLLLLRAKKKENDKIKFAFIVSSVVKKNAPARNLARRRMTEVVRELLPKIETGYVIVLSYKLSNKKVPSFAEFKNDIINLLSLCGVL